MIDSPIPQVVSNTNNPTPQVIHNTDNFLIRYLKSMLLSLTVMALFLVSIYAGVMLERNYLALKPNYLYNRYGLDLPIDLSNPHITSYTIHTDANQSFIHYGLVDRLRNIREIPEGLELTTTIKAANLTKIVITSQTPVFLYKDKQEEATSLDRLKKDQRIRILLKYDLIKKAWTLEKIQILNEN